MTPDQLAAIRQRCDIGVACLNYYDKPGYTDISTVLERDIPALLAEVERLQLELTGEREHAAMLLAGYPDMETPTDIRVLKQANADFAAEVERLRGALENLRPNIKCYLYNNSHSAVPRIALESWINMITAALASAPASDAALDAPALSPSDQHEWEQAQELGGRSSQA